MSPRFARGLVALIALVMVGVVLGPALTHLASRLIGLEYVDHYGTQWFYWFTERALLGGEGFGHTDLFFFPWGKDLYAHTGANVLDGILALPFRVLFGPVLGYNLFLLAGLAAGAWALVRFARRFTDDPVALGLGALTLTLSPYVLYEAMEGRPTQALLVFLVLFLDRTWATGLKRGLGAPLAAGLLLAICGYQYWFYALFGGLACLGHGLVRAIRPSEGAGPWWAVLGRHALIALVAGLLVSPVALPMILQTSSGSTDVPGLLDAAEWTLRSAPPVTVEGTHVGLFEWQPLRLEGGVQVLNPGGTEVFLRTVRLTPWVLLPFLWLWWVRPGRLSRGPVLAMALCTTLVATGPIVLLGDLALPNPVYIELARGLAFFRRLWWPARAYAVMAVLSSLVLSAALVALRERFGARAQALGAVLLAGGWLWHLRGQELTNMPSWDAAVPAGFQCLAQGEEGAVIELPYSWTQAHLYYQTLHGRPILGGMIENNPVFTPDESVKLRQENPFVVNLLQLARVETEDLRPWTPADRDAVGALGYRYVLLQRDAYVVSAQEHTLVDDVQRTRLRRVNTLLAEMLGEPVYQDARVVLYAPWGGASPCAEAPPPPDTVALGRMAISSEERVFLARERDPFERLLDPPASEADTGESDLDTGADLPQVAP